MRKFILFLIIILGLSMNSKLLSKSNKSIQNIDFKDFDPDIRIKPDDSLKINFNTDNTDDVVLYSKGLSGGNVYNILTLHNQIQISYMNYFSSDSLKSDLLKWHSGDLNFLGEQQFDNIEKLGVKMIIEGKIYYGWIRTYFKVINKERFLYVDQYAFCNVPDYPLLWGEKDTGTKLKNLDSKPQLLNVYTLNNHILGITLNNHNYGKINLFTLNGKRIHHQLLNQDDTQIHLNTKGIIIYQFISNKGKIQTGKIMVK